MSEKRKKKLGETGFGKFLKKVGQAVPEVGGTLVDVAANVATGNIGGAIGSIGEALKGAAETNLQAKQLLADLQQQQYQFELEMERTRAMDRDSARQREREYVRAGKFDIEHFLMAAIGLLAFAFVLYTLVFRDLPDANRDLFIHAVGIVEGVVVSMYAYHFGSSKSSRQKDAVIAKSVDAQSSN